MTTRVSWSDVVLSTQSMSSYFVLTTILQSRTCWKQDEETERAESRPGFLMHVQGSFIPHSYARVAPLHSWRQGRPRGGHGCQLGRVKWARTASRLEGIMARAQAAKKLVSHQKVWLRMRLRSVQQNSQNDHSSISLWPPRLLLAAVQYEQGWAPWRAREQTRNFHQDLFFKRTPQTLNPVL